MPISCHFTDCEVLLFWSLTRKQWAVASVLTFDLDRWLMYAGLPQTKLGTYLENRVNLFLKRKDAGAGEVTIRVLSSSEKVVEVRPGMKAKFCMPGPDGSKPEMSDSFPYIAKAIFAFEEIDGIDVCFFGMHVQEFGSNCPPPNARYRQLRYIDT